VRTRYIHMYVYTVRIFRTICIVILSGKRSFRANADMDYITTEYMSLLGQMNI